MLRIGPCRVRHRDGHRGRPASERWPSGPQPGASGVSPVQQRTPRWIGICGDPKLTQVIIQELWLENNTSHPGRGQYNPQRRAVALLLRDHVRSKRPGDTCRRASDGFSLEKLIREAEAVEKPGGGEPRVRAGSVER